MTAPEPTTPTHLDVDVDDVDAEFDRQIHTLVDKGYPALAGMSDDEFVRTLAPLRAVVTGRPAAHPARGEGRARFAVVIGKGMVPIEAAVAATSLRRSARAAHRPGRVDPNFGPDGTGPFAPIDGLDVPAPDQAYVVFDVERGEEFCGAVPEKAMAVIAERGRTPLTIEEGIAFITHFPDVLAPNKCFSLGGSRCGDRRVPALWISQNAPKLGWCWVGNPHSWLGMASAGGRASAQD